MSISRTVVSFRRRVPRRSPVGDRGRRRVRHFGAAACAVALLVAFALVISGPGSVVSGISPLAIQDVAARATVDSGSGYWLLTSAGQVYAFGGAVNYGDMTGQHLEKPMIGMASTPDGKGYWLFGADGGVFAFGDADFYGSEGAAGTPSPVVAGASAQALTDGVGPAGTTGARGATGAAGPAGPAGATGAPGDTGSTGPAGATGSVGPVGPIGTTGAPGPAGPTGPAGQPNYGYIYNLTAEVVAVGAAIDFDSNGSLSGFTHIAGTSSITAVSTGTYLVDFSVSGTEPNQFTLFDNGSPVGGTTYGSGAAVQQNNGQMIVNVTTGGTLTLVNDSSGAAVTLASSTGGTQANVNASLVVEELG